MSLLNPNKPWDPEALFEICFFGAFAYILYQLFLLAKPFFPGLLCAAVLVMAFSPVHVRTRKFIKNRSLAALAVTVLTLLAAALPVLGLGWALVRELPGLLPAVQKVLEDLQNYNPLLLKERFPAVLQPAVVSVADFLVTLNVDIKQLVMDNVSQIARGVTSTGAVVAQNALLALVNAILVAVALFFTFRDGERILPAVISAIPLRSDHRQALVLRAYDTFRGVVMGTLVTAVAQGFTAMLGFWIAGVRLPLLLGLGTLLTALFGASIAVTLPVALWVLGHSVPWGIFLLIWAFLVVGVVDNFLKPLIIGSKARMPYFLIFFSIVGGVKLYGLFGFILGPVLVACSLTFLDLYRKEFKH